MKILCYYDIDNMYSFYTFYNNAKFGTSTWTKEKVRNRTTKRGEAIPIGQIPFEITLQHGYDKKLGFYSNTIGLSLNYT